MRFVFAAAASLSAGMAFADGPVVVTDTPVVHSLVSQVMGEVGTPDVLLEPGADPHSFQLRPSQAAALSDATLVFWVGEELTPWLARTLETLAGEAQAVALLDAEGVSLREFGDDGEHGHDDDDHAHDDHGHDDHDDHAHDDHAHDDHDHDHAGKDPHAWLDPANARLWVTVIADRLSATDPENAATYAANALAAQAAIDAAVEEAEAVLATAHGKPIVTFHDAYGYFAQAFDVDIAGSIALGDAAAPGARRLKELEESVGSQGIACIFREPQHDPSIAEAVATDAGIGLGTLDPSGSSLPYGPDLYPTLIRSLATSIADCVTTSG
jgi:zinc transport system substrate-binding protein